jgi:hypothetical protein
MNNILRESFWAVLMVCLPLATACVKKAAASIGASAEENAKSEVTRRLVQEIANAVADAVAAMNQSYVDDLKKAGTFKEEEQAQALSRAISVAIKSLSKDALDYIKEISGGDTVGYLTTRIQAQISRNKGVSK